MQALLVRHAFALIFSFLLAVYLVPIIIRAAIKTGFVDAPDGRLKHQKMPVPYLGGLVIFVAMITTLGLCYPFENQMLWLLIGSALLLFIGLVDDLKVLKPSQKFFGQFIAVLCFLKGEFSLKTPYFSSVSNVFWSAFWMLSIINAFNLVDVMDGLCGTLAVWAALACGIFAFVSGNYTTSLLLASFIGSVGGFLVFNRPQARIYLGDAGSLFIGGFLSAVPLLLSWPKNLFAFGNNVTFFAHFLRPLLDMFFIPCLVMAVPLFEGLGLFVIRTRMGIPFYMGSPHHFSIYLQKKGWSKYGVLAFASLFASAFCVLSFLFVYGFVSFAPLIACIICLISCWGYAVFLR